MKRILFAIAFGITTLAASANAKETKVTYHALQSFQRDFGNIENVTWTNAKDNLFRASFDADGQTISVYYNVEGDFVATTIALEKQNLPMKTRLALNRVMADYVITELFEIQSNSETAYYAKGIKDGQTKVYKAYSDGSVKEVSKDIFR
jgi:hypothetical protein